MLTNNALLNNLHPQDPNTTDDRPTLNKFRRLGLYIILRHNGHDVDESMPHSEMLAYAQAHERTLSVDGLTILPAEYGGFTVAKPKEVIEHEKEINKQVQEKRDEYKEADWDALKKEALELGLDITRMQKEEVVAALVDAKKNYKAGYEALTWADLKRVAKEKGIEVYGKNRDQILAELKG